MRTRFCWPGQPHAVADLVVLAARKFLDRMWRQSYPCSNLAFASDAPCQLFSSLCFVQPTSTRRKPANQPTSVVGGASAANLQGGLSVDTGLAAHSVTAITAQPRAALGVALTPLVLDGGSVGQILSIQIKKSVIVDPRLVFHPSLLLFLVVYRSLFLFFDYLKIAPVRFRCRRRKILAPLRHASGQMKQAIEARPPPADYAPTARFGFVEYGFLFIHICLDFF